MSTDVQATRMLSDEVAEEIRVLLARRRMSGRELARRLDVSPGWVSYRLGGTQPIDLNDLQRIAAVLGVSAAKLLPGTNAGLAGDLDEVTVRRRIPNDQRVVAIGGQLGQKSTPARAVRVRPHSSHDQRRDHHRPVTQVAR